MRAYCSACCRVAHKDVPVALDRATPGIGLWGGLEQRLLARDGLIATAPAALLCFENETVALVKVDTLVSAPLTALAADHGALEDS
jgi:hypothetical protein